MHHPRLPHWRRYHSTSDSSALLRRWWRAMTAKRAMRSSPGRISPGWTMRFGPALSDQTANPAACGTRRQRPRRRPSPRPRQLSSSHTWGPWRRAPRTSSTRSSSSLRALMSWLSRTPTVASPSMSGWTGQTAATVAPAVATAPPSTSPRPQPSRRPSPPRGGTAVFAVPALAAAVALRHLYPADGNRWIDRQPKAVPSLSRVMLDVSNGESFDNNLMAAPHPATRPGTSVLLEVPPERQALYKQWASVERRGQRDRPCDRA
jgi:hypothetical protein